MTQYIIILPALIAGFYCLLRSSEKAFLSVYIPTLLLLPQSFYLQFGDFPHLSFADWVVYVIASMSFIKIITRFKFSFLDILVFSYIFFCLYSETLSKSGKPALALACVMISNTLLPYVLAKTLLHPTRLSGLASKRIVFMMFINAVLCLYQERFTANPYLQFFTSKFPGQIEEWPVLFRYGLVRVGGPMIQPILFGTVLGIAILLNVWMIRNRLWEKSFKYFPFLPTQFWIFRKEAIIQCFLFMAFILTFSRGTWGAVFLGFILMGAGFTKHRFKSLALRIAVISFIGVLSLQKFQDSIGISPTLAPTEEQATALYRAAIFDKYQEMAMKKPIWGYGSLNWPKIIGMKSVDNQYLFLWLKHGIFAVIAFILLFGWIIFRLFWRGLRNKTEDHFDTTFSFTLAGCFFSLFIVFFVVFMGLQTGHLFFMLLGWGEGFLLSKPKSFINDLLIVKRHPEISLN